jgi:hypothetical protein
LRALDHHRVAHQVCPFRSACFNMLLSVPGAKSSDGLPVIVTRPSFVGCLNWR